MGGEKRRAGIGGEEAGGEAVTPEGENLCRDYLLNLKVSNLQFLYQ